MLVSGSKIRLVKPVGPLQNIGETFEVADIERGTISFWFGAGHLGVMSMGEFQEYFEEVKETKIDQTLKKVKSLLQKAPITVSEIHNGELMVSVEISKNLILRGMLLGKLEDDVSDRKTAASEKTNPDNSWNLYEW